MYSTFSFDFSFSLSTPILGILSSVDFMWSLELPESSWSCNESDTLTWQKRRQSTVILFICWFDLQSRIWRNLTLLSLCIGTLDVGKLPRATLRLLAHRGRESCTFGKKVKTINISRRKPQPRRVSTESLRLLIRLRESWEIKDVLMIDVVCSNITKVMGTRSTEVCVYVKKGDKGRRLRTPGKMWSTLR